MKVGDLRHRITIQAPIGVLDEAAPVNIEVSVPMAVSVLPAPFQQRENLAQGGLQTQTLYTLTCRYREDVQAAYVLREECCTQRTFQILSVIPSDRKDALDMSCVTSG